MAAEAQRANSGLREQGSIARRIHAARDGRAADASIAAAFERRQIAAAALNAMDYFEGPEGQAQLAIMNDAIEAVRAATATTPLGVMLLRAFPSAFAVVSSRDGRIEVSIFEAGND